jgi:hypothetical protein
MSELEEMRKDARAFRELMRAAEDDRGEYVRTVVIGPSPRLFVGCCSIDSIGELTYRQGTMLRSTFRWVDAGDTPTLADFLRAVRDGKAKI